MAHHQEGSTPFIPILIIGGIGYYLYSRGFFSSFFGASSVPGSSQSTTQVPSTIQPSSIVAAATGNPPSSPTPPNQPPAPPPYTPPCPEGQYMYNGVCVAQGATFDANKGTVSQQMSKLAGSDLLSFDEWCYYYQQITGLGCPIDPGSITTQQWNDAGVQASADGTIGDRTTPITIGTWLAFMSLLAPSAGISGLGALNRTLSRLGSSLGSMVGLGCSCDEKKDEIFKGLGQILDFGDFFSLQPHRKHLTGNFR